jgi:hypothetical protein
MDRVVRLKEGKSNDPAGPPMKLLAVIRTILRTFEVKFLATYLYTKLVRQLRNLDLYEPAQFKP